MVSLQRRNTIGVNLRRIKDGVRITIKSHGCDSEDIKILTPDRARWQTKVLNGVKVFEKTRITHVKPQDKFKEECYEKVNNTEPVCPVCDIQCLFFC